MNEWLNEKHSGALPTLLAGLSWYPSIRSAMCPHSFPTSSLQVLTRPTAFFPRVSLYNHTKKKWKNEKKNEKAREKDRRIKGEREKERGRERRVSKLEEVGGKNSKWSDRSHKTHNLTYVHIRFLLYAVENGSFSYSKTWHIHTHTCRYSIAIIYQTIYDFVSFLLFEKVLWNNYIYISVYIEIQYKNLI